MHDGQFRRQGMPVTDVRAMLRLVNELHASPSDPIVRKTRLLDGLCQIVRAHAGHCTVAHVNGGQCGKIVSRVTVGEFPHVIPRITPPKHNSKSIQPTGAPALGSAARPILSFINLPGHQLRANIALARITTGPPSFTAGQRKMVHLFHEEMAWIYGLDLPLASPEVASLPPRQRQTLQLLLAGRSEKQTALQLSVTTNTVHHYVKAIYQHFGVNSRSELLAKWVRSEDDQRPGENG